VCFLILSKWKPCDGPTPIRGFLPHASKYQTPQNGDTWAMLASIKQINIQDDSGGKVVISGGDGIVRRQEIFI
jgi:hypothetical protein